MDINKLKEIIKESAKENNYHIDGGETTFQIYKDQYHSVAFKIIENNAGYLQVHQWEETDDEDGDYGRAIYSLRNLSDVVEFCNIMISSVKIMARR